MMFRWQRTSAHGHHVECKADARPGMALEWGGVVEEVRGEAADRIGLR